MWSIVRGRAKAPGAGLGALFATILLMGALPGSAAAATSITFSGTIGWNCLDIHAPANATLSIVWRNAAGAIKEKTSFVNDGAGFCPTDGTVLASGDKIRVTAGTSTHRLVVPQLSIKVNRARNILRGTGPAGGVVKLHDEGFPWPAFECCMWHDRVPVNNSGNWSRKVWDIRGGQQFSVSWKSAAGDRILAYGVAPYLRLTIDKAAFVGAFRPSATANVTVQDGTTLDLLATATPVGEPVWGRFDGRFRDADQQRYKLQPGDIVTSDIAPDLQIVLPDLPIIADAASDTVSGQCFDTGSVHIYIEVDRNGVRRGYAYSDTDENSQFSIYMPDPQEFADNPAVIKVGDEVSVTCVTLQGDWVTRNVVAE